MQKVIKNTVPFGLLTGVLAPLIGFWIYYFLRVGRFTHWDFILMVVKMHLLSAILSLALLTNLALFFIFLNYKYDYAARGVLLATISYAVIGFIIKFAL